MLWPASVVAQLQASTFILKCPYFQIIRIKLTTIKEREISTLNLVQPIRYGFKFNDGDDGSSDGHLGFFDGLT